MTIMINCLTNTMAIGNKIILLCEGDTSKMFPFAIHELACQMPVGNRSHLTSLIYTCKKYSKEIVVIAPKNDRLIAEVSACEVQFIEKENNYLKQIYKVCETDERVVIIKAESVFSKIDLDMLFSKTENCIAIKHLEKYENAMDHICVEVNQNTIVNFIGHPRVHYSTLKVCGFMILDRDVIRFFKDVGIGFHNINCGQMPIEKYFVEEALQNYVEQGNQLNAIWIENDYDELVFPWDIRKANFNYCKNVVGNLNQSMIDDTASIDDSCLIEGNIIVGKNTIIRQNVIIEGNCIIGDHVIIEKNAVIQKNCVIGSGSKIQYSCKVVDHTVIGSNNKIGFTAEVAGVTFDGVAAVHNCEVFGVIGRKVDIAAGVQMAVMKFDDSLTKQKVNGRYYANEYTNSIFIGDYVRTGINNIFYPGIKVGCKSALGPGLIVSEDVESETLILVEQQKTIKPWGSNKYGW
ncbi:hypothetical protein [Anaerorhabdus sp.]|uniref:hypothetical protein n=1 Tax=Anaerorhabdus sp. TaxID=1872524 RepID=UPI002B1EFAAC|nr:hypothetical protein [Anaerorhabdus sp.]MEA4875461.1 hypothetical protein [Anaerorhabdus sp.]